MFVSTQDISFDSELEKIVLTFEVGPDFKFEFKLELTLEFEFEFDIEFESGSELGIEFDFEIEIDFDPFFDVEFVGRRLACAASQWLWNFRSDGNRDAK